jgi:hypothetical protein
MANIPPAVRAALTIFVAVFTRRNTYGYIAKWLDRHLRITAYPVSFGAERGFADSLTAYRLDAGARITQTDTPPMETRSHPSSLVL